MSSWISAPPLDHATALALIDASTTVDAKIAADNTVENSTFAPGVSVKAYGAKGDGVTLDHVAINAAITANAGRTIYLPSGVYLIDADYATGKGIRLNQAGVQLLLDPGATVKVKANALDRYAAITVTAADCSIQGGKILGDVGTHTGTTGEWGHGIDIQEGAHRARVEGVYLSKCWGDGIIICDTLTSNAAGTKPADVQIVGVVCDDNRRQGISVVTALRPRIVGGSFINTGLTASTTPGAGIAIEPNPGGLQDVIDLSIIGSVTQGNVGRGLYVHSQGRTATGTIQSVRAVSNGAEGFSAESLACVEFIGCTALDGADTGFIVQGGTTGHNVFTACTADGNAKFGFNSITEQISCTARNNGWAGFFFCGSEVATACTATGNNTVDAYYGQFAVDGGTAVRMTGCVSVVGTNSPAPTKGFETKGGTTGTVLHGCQSIGTFAGGAFVDSGAGTFALPNPGAARPTLTAASTAAQIVTALQSLGISG